MWFVVLLCLGASVALGAPPATAEAKTKLVSETQAEAWVKAWQKRLGLDEWKIETRLVRAAELKPETLGNLKWNSVRRSAVIKVLAPIDYDLPLEAIPEDMEYTIVHELVHLQLSVLPRDLEKKDVEETVVNRIADALMGLDKGPAFRARSTPAQPHPATRAPDSAEIAGRAAKP